jgi:acetyltransferase EpsM
MAQPLVVLGTHTFAEELADIAALTGEYEVTAFAENWDRDRCAHPLRGLPVLWIDELAELASTHLAVCGLGTTRRHEFIGPVRDLGFSFATVLHPTAVISATAEIGEGALVGAGCVIAAHARIGAHVIVNRGSLIGHHTVIGDYVTVSPGANVAGLVTLGEGAYVGMGAIVIDRITIGEHAVVGAGAVVTRDVPARVQVQGVPARVVKEGVEGR